MAKTRTAIPREIRDKVLKEFHHKCAIDGKVDPQIHHIDENPSNNDPLNLIPLCPNCHLIDQHNPTEPIDARKLAIFRRYKDPTSLTPQFHPMFTRLLFLLEFQSLDQNDSVEDDISDLIEFIGQLEMGSYYAKKIQKLLDRPRYADYAVGDHYGRVYSSTTPAELARRRKEYEEQIKKAT